MFAQYGCKMTELVRIEIEIRNRFVFVRRTCRILYNGRSLCFLYNNVLLQYLRVVVL